MGRLIDCTQLWNDEDPNDEVLAMVVRTGCNSTIGNMLRHAMRPANFLTATDSLVTVKTLPSAKIIGLLSHCTKNGISVFKHHGE